MPSLSEIRMIPGATLVVPMLLLLFPGPPDSGRASVQQPAAGEVPKNPVARLSFAQALAEALQRNDRLANEQDNMARANLGLKLARSTFHPKVVPNIYGSFRETDISDQTYRMDVLQRLTTGTDLRLSVGTTSAQNQLGNYYNADTTLQLSQPLLRGFGRAVARRELTSAEARVAEAGRQRQLAEQQVLLELAAAYYRLVAQSRLVEVSEKGLERAQRLVEASTAKMEVGRVSQLDVYRARQLAAQAEAQLLDAHGAAEDARERLRFLMGRGPEFDFEVDQEVPREIESLDPEAAVAVALERRLELATARAALSEAERAAAFSRNQMLPQVDVNLALTRREAVDSFAASFGLDHYRFVTFFAISLPADRKSQVLELQNSLLESSRAAREMETLRRRIGDETRRALRQQQRLLKSLELADTSVELAEQEVEVAHLRFSRGLSNNLDVVTAETNLLQAQSRRVSVLADLAVARLMLHATLGVLDPKAMAASQPSPAPAPAEEPAPVAIRVPAPSVSPDHPGGE
jgi:outer membrane protein